MLKVNTPARPSRSAPAMVAGFAPRACAHRWMTSWFAVIRLRPGRSGRSAIDAITCELRTDRPLPRPVRIPPAAMPVDRLAVARFAGDALFAVAVLLAVARLAGAVLFAVARFVGAVRFAAGRADAFFAGAFFAGALRAGAVVRAVAEVRRAAVDFAAVVLFAVVFFAAADLRAAVDVRTVVVFFAAAVFRAGALLAAAVFFAAARFAGALLFAGAAFARLGAARVADFFVAAARPADALLPDARPAGPVLRRPAPPASERIERTNCFTRSGLRIAEMPETPRLRSCPRMSSTRICEIADSETPGVPGVWLPACRLVRVAVPPRPELFR